MIAGILEKIYFGNSIKDYLISIAVFAAGLLAMKLLKQIALKYLQRIVPRTKTKLDDFLLRTFTRTVMPLMYLGIFIVALSGLHIHPAIYRFIKLGSLSFFTIYLALLIIALTQYYLYNHAFRHLGDAQQRESFSKGVMPAVKIVIWAICLIFLLDNLGFQIKTIIASLGIGGVAIALASQAVLADLFCYFAILFDQPFHVGDFIIVGDFLGAVEHIGIKTTRIRSLGGEQLVFSNTDLTNSRLRNYKRMERRRVLFKLGVIYQTPQDALQDIPAIIKDVITNTPDTEFDRAHFYAYGDFSLVFEVVYYVLAADYNKYMDIQQDINLGIRKRFIERGIEFAYPTQTLFVTAEGKMVQSSEKEGAPDEPQA